MSDKKSFTLLLLIKGRHEFTKRWLKYMNKINFNYPIIIADGQDDNETEKMINEINLEKKLSIEYYRYNTHSGYLDYYKMKKDALSKVKTNLVMLCDNDDFIIPSGLEEQINFLSSNKEYISSSGRILNFEINNFEFVEYGKDFYFLNPCKYYRFNEPLINWNDQIKSIFTQFQPNFYNVFKTQYIRIIVQELVEQNFSDLVINEFYIQLRAATLGKSKIIDNTFHYIRQRGTSSISKDYKFSMDVLKKDMPQDVRKMATKIGEILSTDHHISKDNIKNHILKSFSEYLNYFLANTTLKYRFPNLYRFKINIIKILREKLSFMNFIYKKIKSYFVLKKIIYLSDKSKSNILKNELLEIEKLLSKN